MKLISKENVGSVGRVSFADKWFDSVLRVVWRFSQCFKYVVWRFFRCFKYFYVACISVSLYLIWFVCFYDLLNRGVLSTFSNIQDGTFVKIVNDWNSLTIFTNYFILDTWHGSAGLWHTSVEYKLNRYRFPIC